MSGNSPRITYANVSTTCSASSHTTEEAEFTSFRVCDILGGCNVMIDFPNADAYPASNAFHTGRYHNHVHNIAITIVRKESETIPQKNDNQKV